MTLAAGTQQYELQQAHVLGRGFSYTEDELNQAVATDVVQAVYDSEGTDDAEQFLASLGDTGFSDTTFQRIFNSNTFSVEDWRVGEALAETYLAEHRQCHFPWPDSRDERKRGSSLPGADLVGFCSASGEARFAFGEAKTSAEHQYPPGAAYGRTGLKQQLEDLRNRQDIRDSLVKYLVHRGRHSDWQDEFRTAYGAFCHDDTDVSVFGFLVRDVPPDQRDLQARVRALGQGCPAAMHVELFALYLPEDSIADLSQDVSNLAGAQP